MAMLATRERSAARDFVWPPPEDELDALEVIDLRGPATPRADAPNASAPQRLRAVVARTEIVSAAPIALAPARVAPIQHATLAPPASQSVPARATWRARVPRLAAISAMILFATSIGVLLGVRDARRSMTAGYTRLRESVVAVREYVEHVGTPPVATARVTPARPASTPARTVVASPSSAPPPAPAATPESEASATASSLVVAPFIAAQPIAAPPIAVASVAAESLVETPAPTAMAALPGTLAAAPAPRAAAAAIVSTVAAETRVKQALARYQQAYDTLDARAAAASWPSVDVAALTRAFNNLKSQSLIFDRCTVDVASTSTATASCTGSTTAVRQVGSAAPVTRSLHWTFNLRRGGDDTWVIDTVTTTRP